MQGLLPFWHISKWITDRKETYLVLSEKLRSTIVKILFPAAALLLLFTAWQLICTVGDVPKFMLPSPADVANAFKNDWQLMFSHARVTLIETFIGLFFGILIGFAAAAIMDWFSVIRKMLYPLIVVSQTIPTVAIAPILVIWMGNHCSIL